MKMSFEILLFTEFSVEKTDSKTAYLNQLALKRLQSYKKDPVQ